MDNLKKYEEEIKKEIKIIEESKSLKESCYDYFYKKFKDNWEKEFYKQHLKNIKSECHYLNLKLKLETIQKCKELFKEMFKESIFNINRDLIKGNYMDEDEIIDDLKWKSLVSILEKELLSQLNEEDLKEEEE